MIQQEVKEYIKEIIEMENNKGYLSSILLEGENQIHIEEAFEDNYDYRLNQLKYHEYSITVVIKKKETMKSIYMFTIFFLPYEIYKDEVFWKQEGSFLIKQPLGFYRNSIGEQVVTLGYTRFNNDERNTKQIGLKYRCLTLFVEIVKGIMEQFQLPMYIEPEGVAKLPFELVREEKLDLTGVSGECFGLVREESYTTYRFAEWLGLKKVENLYNIYTLGPVFLGNLKG